MNLSTVTTFIAHRHMTDDILDDILDDISNATLTTLKLWMNATISPKKIIDTLRKCTALKYLTLNVCGRLSEEDMEYFCTNTEFLNKLVLTVIGQCKKIHTSKKKKFLILIKSLNS